MRLATPTVYSLLLINISLIPPLKPNPNSHFQLINNTEREREEAHPDHPAVNFCLMNPTCQCMSLFWGQRFEMERVILYSEFIIIIVFNGIKIMFIICIIFSDIPRDIIHTF